MNYSFDAVNNQTFILQLYGASSDFTATLNIIPPTPAPTYTITAIDNQTLTGLTAGYGAGTQQTKTITITRTGTGDLTSLSTAISGANADRFTITPPNVSALSSTTPSTDFTVKAKDGLAAGTYTATITITATNMTSQTFTVTQVVSAAPTYTIATIGDQTLTGLAAGYGAGTQQTKTVTITRTGTGNLASLATAITGANADSFTITQPSAATLNSTTPSTDFTLKAKNGLAEGTYTATIAITADNMTDRTFNVTQVVSAAGSNIYTISADATPFNFGSLTAGYGTAPAAQTVTITNTGNHTITLTEPSTTNASSNYNIGSLSATTLAAGGTAAFTLQPKTGLAVGTYNETISINGYNGSNNAAASVSARFNVTSAGGGGSSSGGGGGSTTPLVTKIESGESVVAANVEKLVQEGKKLTVEGKAGEKLVLDTAALKNIDGQTKDSVKVEIKDVSEAHNDQQPGKVVFSLTITAGGKRITSFGNGTAMISLPYELKKNEKAADVTVWYLAEDGTMSEVPCTYDATTKLATFKVNHFSLYVVGTADTSKWTNPFSDVKENSWFYDAVRYVSANELMNGTTDTTFNPGAKTTRGMIVTILWRMENEPKAAKEIAFTDVENGKYYHDAVAWASEKGIVGGYSAEQFGPEDNITREQLAVILHNYAASKGYQATASGDLSVFGDSGKIHSWSKDAMSWASGQGLIKGSENNLLDPLGVAERCQVAAILQRFVENTVE